MSAASEEGGNLLLNTGGANHTRFAALDECRAFGVLVVAGNDVNRPELIGFATVVSYGHDRTFLHKGLTDGNMSGQSRTFLPLNQKANSTDRFNVLPE